MKPFNGFHFLSLREDPKAANTEAGSGLKCRGSHPNSTTEEEELSEAQKEHG